MRYELTRCPGDGCPLRNDCLRARLRLTARFDSFGAAPYDARTGACAHRVALPATTPDDDAVRMGAYLRWLAEGRPEGRAEAHWQAARDALIAQANEDLAPPFDDGDDGAH
jgi:hypothetical protein